MSFLSWRVFRQNFVLMESRAFPYCQFSPFFLRQQNPSKNIFFQFWERKITEDFLENNVLNICTFVHYCVIFCVKGKDVFLKWRFKQYSNPSIFGDRDVGLLFWKLCPADTISGIIWDALIIFILLSAFLLFRSANIQNHWY